LPKVGCSWPLVSNIYIIYCSTEWVLKFHAGELENISSREEKNDRLSIGLCHFVMLIRDFDKGEYFIVILGFRSLL